MGCRPRVLSVGQARRIRLLDGSRVARRARARNMVRRALQPPIPTTRLQDCQSSLTLDISPVAMDMQLELGISQANIQMEEDDNVEGLHGVVPQSTIVYGEGEFSKVERRCLSIHCLYLETPALRHVSMLPLYHGKCVHHNLGGLNFTCSFCGALAWKIEAKSTREFEGKKCCSSGDVLLPPLSDPPLELVELMQGNNAQSKAFLTYIRAYNTALAFVSLGAHVDEFLSRGRGVYSFKCHGSIYHNIGSLVPEDGSDGIPRFAQLYFFDTENELQNRMHHVSNVRPKILERLQSMMHRVNPYAQALHAGTNYMQNANMTEVTMVIREDYARGWQYVAPHGTELAGIMPGQGDEANIGHRDIVMNYRNNGGLKRISNIHRSYMALLYVLLFPSGEDGWHPYIPRANMSGKFVTQMQYYTYRLQVRNDTVQCLLRGGRLLQQYIVDAYSSMEESRLLWVRDHQKHLRSDVYQGLADMVHARDGTSSLMGVEVGRRIVLPSSFVGSPRYMHQLYQDAMAIVRKRGKPDLFITFTCNPRWREIEEALLPGQTSSDRPDLTTRVFYHKFQDMMHLLIQRAIFGKVIGHVSVIEFQKRGLPHAHILLILASNDKPTEPLHYDKMVCAELPDKDLFPDLHDVISRCNVHGPCGELNANAPCMVNGRCRFKYPKNFHVSTTVDGDGYPTYMRRDDGKTVVCKGNKLSNKWIVPYNPFLSLRYKAHINVEICSTISAVKYMYKYVYKGHDRATVMFQNQSGEGVVDEIKSYLDARYVSASEAIWRIYGFDLHEEKPDIQRLHVHLPFQHFVTFGNFANVRRVVDNEANKKTTLTEWFIANETFPEANELTYLDFPTRWVWNPKEKTWTQRQRGDMIGRMYNIAPAAGDLYFLRILLTKCKGCKSFEDIRTFNGQVYDTFKAACNARGLLQNDEEWLICLEEASFQQSGLQLRMLFVVILVFCEPISPGELWVQFRKELSEDYYYIGRTRSVQDERVLQHFAQNKALYDLESRLQHYGKRLSDYSGMPEIDCTLLSSIEHGVLAEELLYDAQEQSDIASQMERSLNQGQLDAYNQVLDAIDTDEGAVFFLDGPGGTGKTYLYNALLSKIRGLPKVALACASSGIAAQLLSNGRTAHSRFKIPIELTPQSTCNIKVNSQLAELLRRSSLIIWDEAPMMHRYAFEALDRTLRDVMQNDVLFGGKVVLLGGDFRQILPVVRKGCRADIVHASLCHSHIWTCTKVLSLSENIRVLRCLDNATEREFVQWTLKIGDGDVHDAGLEDNVALPTCMLLPSNSLDALIECIYGNLGNLGDHACFFRKD